MEPTDMTLSPGPAQQSDADLVLRARASDATVGAELTHRFGAAIHGYAASWLAGDVECAEDILVETLADGIRNIRRFDPERSSLCAWLFGIARRHIHTELRKRRRAKSVPAWAQVPISDQEQVPGVEDMAVALVDRLEAQRKAARIAAVLSAQEMEVLVLHCVDEFTAKEIGRIVRRSERAVESLLHRAKRKAREEVSGI
jgi:RNA polymerase sigma-70 factor (ECF subfamily)